MLLFVAGWLAISFWGVRRSTQRGNFFAVDRTLPLRGICALEIMLGHIAVYTESPYLYLNRKAGIFFVGLFLMLSGYGVAYGADRKAGYYTGFVWKKFLRLFLPAVFFCALYRAVIYGIGYGGQFSFPMELYIFVKTLNWYVYEQFGLYLLFWLGHFARDRWRDIIVLLGSAVFVTAGYLAGLEDPIYGSTLAFALGLYLYRYRDRFWDFVGEHFRALWMSCTGVCALCFVGFGMAGRQSFIGDVVCRNLLVLSFCMLTVVVLDGIRLGNRLLQILGECSYEIFLIHFFVMSVLVKFSLHSVFAESMLTIGISIAGAVVVHYGVAFCMQKAGAGMRSN